VRIQIERLGEATRRRPASEQARISGLVLALLAGAFGWIILGHLAFGGVAPSNALPEALNDLVPVAVLAVVGAIVASRWGAERDRSIRALRDSEAHARELFEQSGDGILVSDAAARYVDVNPVFCRMLGYERDELLAMHAGDLTATDDPIGNRGMDKRLAEAAGEAGILVERRYRRADGTSLPVEVRFRALADGRQLRIVRDISERVRSDAAVAALMVSLHESQRDLEEAQRIARVGSWTLDLATGDATWSAEMYRILGRDPGSSAVPLPDISALFSPDSVSRVLAAVARATATGEPWRLDLESVRADGTRGWVASHGIVERDDAGSPVRVHGTMQDITDQRQLEDQLRQSQRLEAVGQLAGGIAHDFNNLLTAIRGYAELLGRDYAGDEGSRNDLEQIVLAADRAAELTRQLLAFSRSQLLQPSVIDPAAVVAAVAPMLRRLLGEHIALVTHAAPDLGRVKVDVSQFEQVIVNLAVNAGDAMPEGGTLTIECVNVELDATYATAHPEVAPGPHVGLVVSDTGSGMSEATQARIFEPFFTTKPSGRGTGLGLSTVYGIVKQSGGSIFVYSEHGHGTSFKVYLPRIDEAARHLVDDGPATAVPAGSETVLLVEDEEAVRSFAARVLTDQGYAVLPAADGTEALALSAAHPDPIDLLVTDVIMPGMQGHQLAAQLAARRPGLKVLYISGFSGNAVLRHGVPGEGAGVLAKPFSSDALGRAARVALDAPWQKESA
jgi:two-component system cell cycle sensor histidine kinase/response regulator CckA